MRGLGVSEFDAASLTMVLPPLLVPGGSAGSSIAYHDGAARGRPLLFA
jgi:hypothetical protein